MTESELRDKVASLAPAGDAVSKAVLTLFADRDRLTEAIKRIYVYSKEPPPDAGSAVLRLGMICAICHTALEGK